MLLGLIRYILLQTQIPNWLDIYHPKIKIVTHEQIMPKDALPTFNSEAIEACLANIDELSEYFLYANDDCFIGRPVEPSFFFDENNNPIIRFSTQNWSKAQIDAMHFRNTIATMYMVGILL